MQFERKIQEQQGSGMGLIIAKRLTELYGGSLSIGSTPNVTTKVSIVLPT
jgi:signal transduction histidine kinase